MAADGQPQHRPGALKQQNKTHKSGRHRTKGQLDKDTKGRVSVKVLSKKAKQNAKKSDRRNQALQLRKNKRDEVLAKKRSRGSAGSPPHLVLILPLCNGVYGNDVLELIKTCDDTAVVNTSDLGVIHISVPRFKQRFAFMVPEYGNLTALLDAAKVADSMLLMYSPEFAADSYGDYCLACLQAQGMPSALHGVQGLKAVPLKKQTETKKMIQKYIERRFPKEKCHSLDSSQEAVQLLHHISSQKLKPIHLRERRPHLVGESVSFELNDENSQEGTLKVSGYVRGCPLSVNGLVHIPGWGDFQMKQIDAPRDPFPLILRVEKERKRKGEAMDEDMADTKMEEDIKVLETAQPSHQESLQSEVIPDPMEGEQTWPTEEELREADTEFHEKKTITKKVPKGTSEYQAAWIVDSGDEGEDEDDESESEDGETKMAVEDEDDDEDSEANDEEEEEEDDGTNTDKGTVSFGNVEKYDADYDMDEEEKMLEKYKAARADEMFPDEVDTPMDTPARVRFQRYRGLKSFRTSPWDPKENLPADYARIFQFENFKRTKKRVLEEEKDGAEPGWYVTVHVANVPRAFMESYTAGSPVVLYGLLSHEQKMSVVHFMVKRLPQSTEPIKSKERLIFHVGYRRFAACPIFSQHTNGDKHKFEKFFKKDMMCVATVFAPIIFPPASVLVFKEQCNGDHDLIATGSVLSVNPDRIVAKRVVLSGHAFKINKKSAVVRYMFFNREDILWFKPVELRTKYGRRGHIKEALGTHGHMKCIFDGQLKSQDTVLMNLYKRMYPKWTYDPHVATPPNRTSAPLTDVYMDDISDLF
ncbi:pre-rRNA-processing protein TSR1 homolog [Lingula anatina]|uniref:Pre-rRNA-processing protein TSR1 homolog n=1 Tax=Lingula anatina TaxID=7574 RepID=A0A1S3JMQ7_LINAN|nr:pre-rRNA-processing protein TSR1 homolog [Lingula anatina]|eukprot:XP_013411658.1 pre-rRNA-processing protein TSR1 homolog [Lingula anatina]